MNGDYEDALLRLLAGEGGFLILESEPALRDLRTELETSNPNTGLYREFAAIDVRLNQAHLDLSTSAIDEIPDLDELIERRVGVARRPGHSDEKNGPRFREDCRVRCRPGSYARLRRARRRSRRMAASRFRFL